MPEDTVPREVKDHEVKMAGIRGYFKNTGRVLVFICVLSFLIRLSFFIALQPWSEKIVEGKVLVGDSSGYHMFALDILNTHSFANFDTFRTPGYPLLLAFVYSLLGIKPWIVLLLQIFMEVGLVIIVYLLSKAIFNSEQISLIAAFLYSINFLSAYYSVRLLTEISFTFIFALGILFFSGGLKYNKLSGFVLGGLFVGLATLIRPIAQYFPIVLVVVILFSSNKISQKLINVIAVLIVFFAIISPWQFRNLITYGYYELSTISGTGLARTSTILAKVNSEEIDRAEAKEELVGNAFEGVTNPFEAAKIYRKIAFSYISKNPIPYAKYYFKRIVMMFLGTSRVGISDLLGIKAKPFEITEGLSLTAHKIITKFYNELPTIVLFTKQTLEYLFLIIGLAIPWTKDKKIFALLLILIICYFAAATGAVGYSRFRVPIVPFYLLISAKGIYETFRRRSLRL